jgi:hypothetical protein
MASLAFLDDTPLFDGECVRFTGMDGTEPVLCGVTTYALQYCDPSLPHHGLLPAEAFIAAYRKLLIDIHQAARAKYQSRAFEPEGPVRILVHRKDIAP